MNAVILSKTYAAPPLCEREILRYAGCKQADDEVMALLRACVEEASEKLVYKVCYRKLAVTVDGDVCDFGVFRLRSHTLAVNLKGCKAVVLFAATVGVGMDRLITRYGHISPAKALLFQAIGAERIEALCNAFCQDIMQDLHVGLKPRFSPGYGDLPLQAQKDIFAVLDCEKRIGLTLNDSLLMSPSKSVTAFVGLFDSAEGKTENTCSACEKRDCTFRGVV